MSRLRTPVTHLFSAITIVGGPLLTISFFPPFWEAEEQRLLDAGRRELENQEAEDGGRWMECGYLKIFNYRHIEIYIPGTQMTSALIGVWAFFWVVKDPKTKDKQVPGSRRNYEFLDS